MPGQAWLRIAVPAIELKMANHRFRFPAIHPDRERRSPPAATFPLEDESPALTVELGPRSPHHRLCRPAKQGGSHQLVGTDRKTYDEAMRTLIDGYNVMHARGLMDREFGPDGLRKARHQFLADLAAALDPADAATTTVVFDAADPPANRPDRTSYKGLTIVFAVGDEDADARIEALIAAHPSPKQLTVVSADLRIRRAAERRRARIVTSDLYLSSLSGRRRTQAKALKADQPPARDAALAPAESAYWLDTFRHVADEPGVADGLRASDFVPTDEEIARIEREVREER